MYSHYKLRGSGWNKTEKEIRKRVEAAGMTTRWKFKTVVGEDGKEGFESSVSCSFSFSSFSFGCEGDDADRCSCLRVLVQPPPRSCKRCGPADQHDAGHQRASQECHFGQEERGRDLPTDL